jgi:death-on-curing protein
MVDPMDIGDLIAVGALQLDLDPHTLKRMTRIAEAESALAAPHASFGGDDFYPEPTIKAAILCSRVIRNHPLPDGNKRTAFLLMLLQLDRYGLRLKPLDQDYIAGVIEDLTAGRITEATFVEWVADNVEPRGS